jgi:hypothetical protein
MPEYSQAVIDRFMSHVSKEGDCWLWKGTTTGGGYGCFSWGSSWLYAHRVAVRLFIDSTFDPKGRGRNADYVIHSCDIKRCVAPAHLRVAAALQNNLETIARHPMFRQKVSNGKMGHKVSLETRAKIAESLKGNKNRCGRQKEASNG